MRCAVSFLTVIVLSVAVALMALYIIWITENEDDCEPGFRCLPNAKCIQPKDTCNKIVNCPDGSDEAPIHCNDLTTFPEMVTFMMTECRNHTLPDQPENVTKLDITKKPEMCTFIRLNDTPNKGIKCNGTWLERVPWNQFDRNARIISIDHDGLNTSRLTAPSTDESNGTVIDFPSLDKLYIDYNRIDSVDGDAFCHMKNLCWFSLVGNGIKTISPLCPMRRLRMLKMSENRLTLQDFYFKDMPLLRILYLDYNHIEQIHETMFSELHNLKMLNISHNRISYIHEQAFTHNVKLIELDLTGNSLKHIETSLFSSQRSLKKLYISDNPKELFLPALLFHPLANLTSLKIESLEISQIDTDAFKFTPILDYVYFKKFSYCRFVPRARRCYPNSDGLSSTSNLLIGQSRITVWFVGLVTLLGNIFVLAKRVTRKRSTTQISKILNIFVTNLALADFLMGVYLLILACKDVQFRGIYSAKAYEWGTNPLCTIIGIIALISSEVSLLILTIMSLDRYLTIRGPFSQGQNLSINLARASMLIIWTFAGILALAPAVQWQAGGNMAFYGTTGLCFPIHLDERKPVGWQYTTFVFVGVNSCCLILITISYSLLFYTVRKTQSKTPVLVQDIELAGRFFLMVFTDVLCWAPIIILKISVLCGYELSKEIIGWAVIYVLPINSAVNPILYTFSTKEARKAMLTHLNGILQNWDMYQSAVSRIRQRSNREVEGETPDRPIWMSRFSGSRRARRAEDDYCGGGSSGPALSSSTGGLSGQHHQDNHHHSHGPDVTPSEDTELTHSICPTIMTNAENSSWTGVTLGSETMAEADFKMQGEIETTKKLSGNARFYKVGSTVSGPGGKVSGKLRAADGACAK